MKAWKAVSPSGGGKKSSCIRKSLPSQRVLGQSDSQYSPWTKLESSGPQCKCLVINM